MGRVLVTETFSYNATGYDREETVFSRGEQSVSARVADYIARTPYVGRVLEADEVVTEDSAPEDTSSADSRVVELEAKLKTVTDDLEASENDLVELRAELGLAKVQTTDDRVADLEAKLTQLLEEASAKDRQILELRLQAMNVADLTKYASEQSIDLTGKSNKADILAAILAASAAASTPSA